MFERSRGGERAVLVQPVSRADPGEDALLEFIELAHSAGAQVLATVRARIDRPNPGTLIGSGKLEELRQRSAELGADLLLVNHALSPVQERNLEKALKLRVVDRTGLILDIFAQRARSHEGKLQVELAQLKHMSTRLVRGWTHLERQRGGSIGLRGPGETQLETDRRLLAARVKMLSRQLELVAAQREMGRRARVRSEIAQVALVGYTNAGKSTLFNALTGAGVHAADQLFATLDPTLRRIEGWSCGPWVLADTVGFVRDLPHDLIAAFRSTLTEAREAQLLLHVVDAADPLHEARIDQVRAVLDEIGAGDIPELRVMNKIDRAGIAPRIDLGTGGEPRVVWLSAATGLGLELLRTALSERLAPVRVRARVHVAASAGRLRARLFELGAVVAEQADEQGWSIELDLPRELARQLCGQHGQDGRVLREQLFPDDGEAEDSWPDAPGPQPADRLQSGDRS